jgi:hypothetical protein
MWLVAHNYVSQLLVSELSRLGRSAGQIIQLIDELLKSFSASQVFYEFVTLLNFLPKSLVLLPRSIY